MASPTRWTWVCMDSRSWWWIGRPGELWFMGSQRVGHDWVTELNWTNVHALDSAWVCVCAHMYVCQCIIVCVCVCVGRQRWEGESSQLRVLLLFSCSVMSDSLRPHELQHTRPPCPSPTPGAYSNSCPSNWWCHPTISSSVVPFSSCP